MSKYEMIIINKNDNHAGLKEKPSIINYIIYNPLN